MQSVVWTQGFPGEAASIGEVRHFVGGLLTGWPCADDARLVATELATNAVQHTASGEGRGFAVCGGHRVGSCPRGGEGRGCAAESDHACRCGGTRALLVAPTPRAAARCPLLLAIQTPAKPNVCVRQQSWTARRRFAASGSIAGGPAEGGRGYV